MRVSSLHIYPVKGVRAVHLDRAEVKPRGLEGDRRWLITDEGGGFLTQRTCPALARIAATPIPEGLNLSYEGASFAAARPAKASRRSVKIWNDEVNALDAGDDVGEWLSAALGRPARLFYMDAETARTTSGRWGPKLPVSFADSYPLLVTTTASLEALNKAIGADGGEAVPMKRFRPNIVIDGADPWAEDFWKTIRIGNVTTDLAKPCDRCVVTTLDPETGIKTGREPLKTLHKIRRSAHPDLSNVVLFGWNSAPRGEGAIAVGDKVEIVEERPEGWPLA
ncbi:MOSC domain-containing protein [Hyphococcus sp.]|uniref:MOSC domain-containing protein n=1 Tax=Hyphococcus sp. TaxID=2038636 RepID=UPI003D0A4A5E